jgi:hypothetical protein
MAKSERPERVTVLACGCEIHVCLCGCDESDYLTECRGHADGSKTLDALRDLFGAANLVEANWEGAGLAEAVRFLLVQRDEAQPLLPAEAWKVGQ